MRTGPFSQTKVIEKLNAYFVPVYLAQEDLATNGAAPPADKAEYQRIFREALAQGLSTGTVHVFLIAPDGKPLDSLHVANAAKTETLLAMLDRTIAKLKLEPGKPLVVPKPQSSPPTSQEGSLVLHLASQSLRGGGSWDGISENWIVYEPKEIPRLLPKGDPAAGDQWQIDPKLAARLLTHVYPVTENNDVTQNKITDQSLSGRVVSREGSRVLARLDGRLKMRHNFYYKDDGNTVEATLAGYVEFDAGERPQVRSLKLATVKASYGGGEFGVAIRLAP
jgi:hypothetical protein